VLAVKGCREVASGPLVPSYQHSIALSFPQVHFSAKRNGAIGSSRLSRNTLLTRVAMLANYECVWLQIFLFGDLANFWQFFKAFGSKFLIWRNVRSVYLHVFAYRFICRFTIFKLADGLKIHDVKWKFEEHGSKHFLSNMFPKCWNSLFRNI